MYKAWITVLENSSVNNSLHQEGFYPCPHIVGSTVLFSYGPQSGASIYAPGEDCERKEDEEYVECFNHVSQIVGLMNQAPTKAYYKYWA